MNFKKKNGFDICKKNLSLYNQFPFLDQIITCNEKWVYFKNVVRKRQWFDQGESPLPTPKIPRDQKKIMLSVWWDIKGILHYEFLETNETIDSLIYSQQLITLNDKLFKMMSALFNKKKIFLLHDNSKPHVSKNVSKTIKDLGFEILPHPPYSPDLVPSDYYLFKHLQNSLEIRNILK